MHSAGNNQKPATRNQEPRTSNPQPVPTLQFHAITKSFFGVPVLKEVSFIVPAGQTLGLVGENGAGKSTLMNILGGNLTPDAGQMSLAGEPHAPAAPKEATRAGVAFIHQELNLFPNLSIAENLFLAAFPRLGQKAVRGSSFMDRGSTETTRVQQRSTNKGPETKNQEQRSTINQPRTRNQEPRTKNQEQGTSISLPWIDRRTLRSRTTELLRQVGLSLSPDTLVERLSAGERQLVEIAKALSIDPRLIILDEPTTSLTAHETEHLFALLGRLRARGIAMIYISHALNDVLRLCDSIVVLRDGAVVGQGPRAEWTTERMITLMVGREMEQLFPQRPRSDPPPPPPSGAGRGSTSDAGSSYTLLEVSGVTQPGIVADISFRLRAGEVLGISGLMGSGRTELARILFGLDPLSRGSIHLAGRPIERLSPRERVAAGLALLTESRRDDGLCLDASIADNLSLVALPRHASGPVGWLDQGAMNAALQTTRRAVTLSASARDLQPVKTLSGGNQQKVVLAKWLLNEPRVFILDEPTRGIDVGAKHEVYSLINQLVGRGAGVLMISSEIEELIGMCDRILVMNRGRIRDEIHLHQFDRERILKAALHEGHLTSKMENPGAAP
ncbi:MAG: sugar ABC transporter ATP-binding protein [Verrucomicrobia bacterium]|nr:sugar ABC transporter ATP-binding protein [Verrucomicrobiota bacterium]